MSLIMTNLTKKSQQVRAEALKMIFAAQSGHPGPSLSAADILTALYYDGYLKFDAKNPKWSERDYFFLSKGHACPALYAILGDLGFFSTDEFCCLRQIGALLQGHPEPFIPGIEVASGPLGQGVSVANGVALGLKIDNKPNKVFVLTSDGELQEGNIWEAVMTAAKYKLDNLVAIVDRNGLQIDGTTAEVKPIGDVGAKFAAFDWEVIELADGHDFTQIKAAFDQAIAVKGKPTVIIAHTIKGKGVSFMENQVGWQGIAPNEEQLKQALQELSPENSHSCCGNCC